MGASRRIGTPGMRGHMRSRTNTAIVKTLGVSPGAFLLEECERKK